LIERYSLQFRWKAENLATALFACGPLSEAGQEQLIHCLFEAFNRYQRSAKTVKRVTPSEQRDQLSGIETTAQKLLFQLGINVKDVAPRFVWKAFSDRPPMERVRSLGKQTLDGQATIGWLSQASIDRSCRDADSINSELRKAGDDVANCIIALLSLHERAKAAAQLVATSVAPGTGGPRHHPGKTGQLTSDLIAIYEYMRAQHPDSGNKPGLGGPIRTFVQAVSALLEVPISDSQINEAWRRRESNSK
jgi:hypothetical protein